MLRPRGRAPLAGLHNPAAIGPPRQPLRSTAQTRRNAAAARCLLFSQAVEPALETIVSADEELRARIERVTAEGRAKIEAAEAQVRRQESEAHAGYEREVARRAEAILAAARADQDERAARRSQAVAERLAAARAALPAASDAFARLVREGPES